MHEFLIGVLADFVGVFLLGLLLCGVAFLFARRFLPIIRAASGMMGAFGDTQPIPPTKETNKHE
jgi:hypothetical protein